MRWQEEVTLTSYEMQWTVRYFLYMSRKWVLQSSTGYSTGTGTGTSTSTSTGTGTSTSTGTGNLTGTETCNLTGGAIAYHKRKHAVWEDLAKKADSLFRSSNTAYQSPL
jgi:hypothetical protein